jgi:mono/diheme cytochrome c family protein
LKRAVMVALVLSGVAGAAHAADGKKVFNAWCQPCHGEVGPGTYMLAKRLGADQSRLEKRDDLTAEYIRFVVRNGLNGMLAFRKTEVTESELDAVIDYLTHHASKDRDAR